MSEEARQPDVSVLITAYRASSTLRRAVETALDQDGVDHEVIVVMDGTDEAAEDVLGAIADSRVRVLRPGRIGRCEALNLGIANARSDLIAIHDADDEMLPARLTKQVAFLRANPGIDGVGGQLEQYGPWGSEPWRFEWPTSPQVIDAWLARGRMPVPHPSLTMRRSLIERAHGYDPSATRAEDLDLLLRSWRAGHLANLDDTVTRYRVRSPFPSLRYWRREQVYRHAIVTRYRRSETGPIRVTAWDAALRAPLDVSHWLLQRTIDWTRRANSRRLRPGTTADGSARTVDIAGIPIRTQTLDKAVAHAIRTATESDTSETYRFLNAYTFLLSRRDPIYHTLLRTEGINFPDGRPLAVLVALMSKAAGTQVRGPAFMREVVRQGRKPGLKHHLLGATQDTLARLREQLTEQYPGAQVVGTTAPPFRELTAEELRAIFQDIKTSGADIVWVGTGAPRQDFLAARVRDSTGITAVGVGAAFDFIAGVKSEAPHWLGSLGLEWAFRLATEPKRLWRRYLEGNLHFVAVAARAIWKRFLGQRGSK